MDFGDKHWRAGDESRPSRCHSIEESPEEIGQLLGRFQFNVFKNRGSEGSMVELGVTRLPK